MLAAKMDKLMLRTIKKSAWIVREKRAKSLTTMMSMLGFVPSHSQTTDCEIHVRLATHQTYQLPLEQTDATAVQLDAVEPRANLERVVAESV